MQSTSATTLAPWIEINNTAKAVAFYKAAFSAIETYRVEDPDGNAVVKLSINGAEFWLSDAPDNTNKLLDNPIRMILNVTDPDAIFKQALNAGATEVYPVNEQHGWRTGRLIDPFGLHWEVAKELA